MVRDGTFLGAVEGAPGKVLGLKAKGSELGPYPIKFVALTC